MDDFDDFKNRLEHLRPEQQAEFRDWFLERDHRNWDAQIARDLKAGKLDGLIAEANADCASLSVCWMTSKQ
jgi:hypothetical protein